MGDEETLEPNLDFVREFDKFHSFSKAAAFIEDWIRSKKNNATDFTNDFPALLDRGVAIRRLLIRMRDGRRECELN